MLTVHVLHALKDNFVYVLRHADGRCAVVDPGDSQPVENFLANTQCRLEVVLCTHHHWDHIQGAPDLQKKHGAEIWGSFHDSERLPRPNRALREGVHEVFGERLEVLDVPGHTLGQVAFHFPSQEALFVGDTLFSAGCGRLFEGSPEMMFASLAKIKSLPPSTKIYFGHEYTLRNLEFVEHHQAAPAAEVTTYKAAVQQKLSSGLTTTPSRLSEELVINPFLRANSVEEFAYWRKLRDHW